MCEHVRQALNGSAGVTASLEARLLKYYLLKKKREYLTKKDPKVHERRSISDFLNFEFRILVVRCDGSGDYERRSGGRESKRSEKRKGRKRISQEGWRHCKGVRCSVSCKTRNENEETGRRRRSRQIAGYGRREKRETFFYSRVDDEPDDGPDMYAVVHGFSSTAVLLQCAEIGVSVDCVTKVADREDRSLEESLTPELAVEEENEREGILIYKKPLHSFS